MGARCLIFKIKLVQELCKLKFYLGQGVMCVMGGDITLASVLRNLNFAQRIKPFPGHTESARIQNYAAPKFNFLQPSKHFNFKETYFDYMGGGGLLGSKAAITDFRSQS